MPAKKKPPKGKKTKGDKEKTGKKTPKAKAVKESDVVETIKANAALLELKLKVTEKNVTEFQEHSYKVTCANEQLINQLYQTESESLDMTAYWEKQISTKEKKIGKLEENLKNEQILALEEKTILARDLNLIQEKMKEKDAWEAQLEKELINTQLDMEIAEKEHMEYMKELEKSHTQEKVRLAKEIAEKCQIKIAKLKQDHLEEVIQLKRSLHASTTERDWLNDTLKHATKDMEELKDLANLMLEKNKLLELDKQMLQTELEESTTQMNRKERNNFELKAQVASLQNTLITLEEKIEQLKDENTRGQNVIQASQVELDKMQQVLAMREKEICEVKKLGKIVIEKRTELEIFFHEALDHVRQEIAASRIQERKEALQDYQVRVREAITGKTKLPPICNFQRKPYNYINPEVGPAPRWAHLRGCDVRISDLTWEQKEDVLCLLFARINEQTGRKVSRHLAICDSFEDQTSHDDTSDVD